MQNKTNLNNYFMLPTETSFGLKLYPVKLFEWERFNYLANKFIVMDIKTIDNSLHQQFQKDKLMGTIPRKQKYKKLQFDNLLDYILDLIYTNSVQIDQILSIKLSIKDLSDNDFNSLLDVYKNDEQGKQLIKFSKDVNIKDLVNLKNEFSELIKIVTHCKKVIIKKNQINIVFEDNNKIILDKDNFYEFREIVMEQNLLYEPLIVRNLDAQEMIDIDLKRKYGDEEMDLESLVAFVSTHTNKDIKDYTYYRLKADFTSLMMENNYNLTAIYRANGCTTKNGGNLPMPNILAPLSINKNPYDGLFKESKENSLDKRLTGK